MRRINWAWALNAPMPAGSPTCPCNPSSIGSAITHLPTKTIAHHVREPRAIRRLRFHRVMYPIDVPCSIGRRQDRPGDGELLAERKFRIEQRAHRHALLTVDRIPEHPGLRRDYWDRILLARAAERPDCEHAILDRVEDTRRSSAGLNLRQCGAREVWIPEHHLHAVVLEREPGFFRKVGHDGRDLACADVGTRRYRLE